MHFTTTLVTLAVLLTSASARPSLSEICDANGPIISQKTLIAPSGREIKFTTRACPGLASLRNTTAASNVRKRQNSISQCDPTPSCYDVECDTSAPQPSLQDCENLTSYLINLNETISIPPESVIEADGGNCFYKYGVVDNVSYDVCTNTWGVLGLSAVTGCFINQYPTTTFTAGFCRSPQVPDNSWIVESGFYGN